MDIKNNNSAPDSATVIEVKSSNTTDIASEMMKKVIMFLTKIWADKNIIKSLIENVTPKLEAMSKKDIPNAKQDSVPEDTSMPDENKPQDNKPLSLQDELMKMC